MAAAERTVVTPGEAVAVAVICFGYFALRSVQAVFGGFPSDPFTDESLVGVAFWEVLAGALAIAFLHTRGFALASLLPRPSPTGCAIGIVLYFAATLGSALLQMPFSAGMPAQPILQMLAGSHLSLPAIALTAVVNGAFEEIFLLGVLTRGLRGHGLAVAFGVPSLVRVLCHAYQGPLGVLSILVVGGVLGGYYLRTTRLWPPVFAHMLLDIAAFAALRA